MTFRNATDLARLLLARADAQPGRVAYRFTQSDPGACDELTHADLASRVAGMASFLRARCEPGTRVALIFDHGPEFVTAFFACAWAALVAVPLPPPRGPFDTAHVARIRRLLESAAPGLVLTTGKLAALLRICGLEEARWPASSIDELAPVDPAACPPVPSRPEMLIQFSSGSTGDPRGVLLTHANLLANSEAIRQAFEHDEESVGVSWLPHFHDMGLVGGVLQPLYAGFPVTLMASGDFVRRPLRWLSLVSELGATTSGGPTFAYAHCCKRIRPDEVAGLFLHRWRVAFCGAEPVDDQVFAAFARRFASAGFDPGSFVPCYGLAEASLLVSAHRRGAALQKRQASLSDPAAGAGHARPVVGCGEAASGVRVAIFHPERAEVLPDDHVGEVCVAGPSVSPGYWRDGAMLPGASVRHPADGESWLRTGDLGFLLDGGLYISGRLKDVIKIGGKTTHALDIEAAMQDCDSRLNGGASVAVQVWSPEGGELVLVQEMPRDGASPEGEPVSRKLYACVVERFGIRPAIVVVVRAGAVPRTTSGKVRRVACGQPLQVFPGKHVLESYPSKWSAP